MKIHVFLVALVMAACATLFTWLFIDWKLSEVSYVTLLITFALVCIALLGFPRLKELDLKNLKLTLAEIRQVKSEVQDVKKELADMYGGIENLQSTPYVLDKEKMEELGLRDAFVTGSATMRYPTGCIKRERERLARIFVNEKTSENIAKAILDSSLDDKVFKWNGPEVPLDADPKSLSQRQAEKADQEGEQA